MQFKQLAVVAWLAAVACPIGCSQDQAKSVAHSKKASDSIKSKREPKPEREMPSSEEQLPSGDPATEPEGKLTVKQTVSEEYKEEDYLPELKLPEVRLSKQHEAMCLVKVGDRLPDAELPDLKGSRRLLKDLYGETYTLVYFWTPGNRFALEGLKDLGPQAASRYGSKGLKVVGISLRTKPEEARRAVEDAHATYPNLLDAKGAYFAKVASEKLPRIYLLDDRGRIVWFDIEYSRSTRRQLQQALYFLLSNPNEEKVAVRSTTITLGQE